MFTPFFYALKNKKVPVSITEWMILMEALEKGLVDNLNDFYYLARAVLVKSETHFDQYDIAFQEYFNGIAPPLDITEELLQWLTDPQNRPNLTPEQIAALQKLNLEELIREYEKRLQEQKEQHDGGNRWIGTGGTSPFGHSGVNPQGMLVGGPGGMRSAIRIAEQRYFRNYRSDVTLDVRQLKVALKQLRQLNRVGAEDELDLEKTIDATCKNAGELEFKWKRPRKNAVKLLLLMDAGGSMEPFAELCSRLFSAANTLNHFKSFKYYYFHNCPYDVLYPDIQQRKGEYIEHLLKILDSDYKVIFVGDACMAQSELLDRFGDIYFHGYQKMSGHERLKQIKSHFSHVVWLNPERSVLRSYPTVQAIKKLFPMYDLTLDGLNLAVKKLTTKR
ncbi:MAG: VWA domain-containing protein [Dehalococcoidia bacterium]|nr:VWA domain-containing protein [Dehalococcoidia bacterium]